MAPKTIIFKTNGSGFWSSKAKPVEITGMEMLRSDWSEYGELQVAFNTCTWNTETDGLIYTDEMFLDSLREFCNYHGLPGDDVDYSEAGMQGDDFVSFDVGLKFLKAWKAKFGG